MLLKGEKTDTENTQQEAHQLQPLHFAHYE